MKRTDPLDSFLESGGFDAFFMRDTSENSNMYYLSGFEASDPFVFLRKDGKSVLLVPQLELSRAKEEATVDKVRGTGRYVDGEARGNMEKQLEAFQAFLDAFDAENLAVPEDFPLKLAEDLKSRGLKVAPVEDQIMDARKRKDEKEVEKLKQAQRHTEEAMGMVKALIEDSEVRDGVLYNEDEKLTSEKVKSEIRKFLIDRGCEVPEETIVSSGPEGAKTHATGAGPIKAGQPILVDIYPRCNNYFGDMTRTFVKGEPSQEVEEMQQAVSEALEAALEVFQKESDLTTDQVHDKVCDIFEEHGHQTLRDGDVESGFIHSTGHAVGLDLHEPPRIADNGEKLEKGNVLTIEPGLYLPETGGVRLEDMILVTDEGYENFNSMSREIQID